MSTSDLSVDSAVVLALVSTILLAALHLAAPHIRKLPLVPEHVTASFAGGLAVSYVFLHLLPEIARGSREVGEVLGDTFVPSPLVDLVIFTVALAGFLLFYGLERLAMRSSGRERPTATARGGEGAPGRLFALHLASFMLYNAVIAYTLPTTWRVDGGFAVLFVVAIGLHFVLTDRGLEEHYRQQFDRRLPRLLLASALVAGWAVGALFAPTRTVVVSLLTAFLAGGILLNVFKEEIPSTRRSHFGWFTAGLMLYAVLLGVVTWMGDEQDQGEEQNAGQVVAIGGAFGLDAVAGGRIGP